VKPTPRFSSVAVAPLAVAAHERATERFIQRMRVCRAEGDSTHAASINRKARERVFRVDLRQRVRVLANQLGRFEPRDRWRIESASSRHVRGRVAKRERFPGVRSWRPSARHTRVRNHEVWMRVVRSGVAAAGEASPYYLGAPSASINPRKNFLPLANTMSLPTARVEPSFAW
jgi:hypothetical protein